MDILTVSNNYLTKLNNIESNNSKSSEYHNPIVTGVVNFHNACIYRSANYQNRLYKLKSIYIKITLRYISRNEQIKT